MEIRDATLISGAAGGTAGKGAKTYKLALPSVWVRALGLDGEARQAELLFDGDRIILRKKPPLEDWARAQRARGHEVRVLRLYDEDRLCSTVCADFTEKTLRVENHTDALLKTAFGRRTHPTWEDFQNFLEERCVPRQRAGLREYLEALGLEDYDPLAILQKTGGRMAEDHQWLEVETLP